MLDGAGSWGGLADGTGCEGHREVAGGEAGSASAGDLPAGTRTSGSPSDHKHLPGAEKSSESCLALSPGLSPAPRWCGIARLGERCLKGGLRSRDGGLGALGLLLGRMEQMEGW